MRDDETASAQGTAPALQSRGWVPERGASYYALRFMFDRPAARRKQWQEGVALGAQHLYWDARADGARSYQQISRISLSFYDKAEGDGGFCRVTFTDSSLLTVASGVHAGARSVERETAYDAFLHDLHARLSLADRQRILFQDGIPIPNRSIVIGAAAAAAVGLVPAAVAAFVGDPRAVNALIFGLTAAGVVGLGMLFAQGRTEGRRYDPDFLPEHALFGRQRIAQTDAAPG